tara:strand:+ start:68 stop:622 length:555 start_codon:yes stop_codon:yes gene_type:complete
MSQISKRKLTKIISSSAINRRVIEIAQDINNKYSSKLPLIVGVLNGSFIFLADLVRNLDIDVEISFIKASSYDGKHKSDIIKIDFFDFDKIKGKDIIIIEDIVDTGDTVRNIRNKMINKANSVAIAAFLLKPNKSKVNFEIDWVGFEIPDEFVVGYGLDYNQKFRNLNGIYQGIEIYYDKQKSK